MSTWHYCWGKKFGQFTRKCFSNDTFWLPLPIMSKGSRGSLWEYTKFKIKMVKSMPLFRQRRLKTIFFGTVRSYIAYIRVPPSLPNPIPPTTTSSPSPLPPSLWIVRLNKFNVKILSAWIAVFSTRLRTEKKKKRDKRVDMPSKNWKWSTNWALMPRKPWCSPWPVSWRLLESIFLTHQR